MCAIAMHNSKDLVMELSFLLAIIFKYLECCGTIMVHGLGLMWPTSEKYVS